MPMCLTAKATFEWAGSTVQVPVGTTVLVEVLMVLRSGGDHWSPGRPDHLLAGASLSPIGCVRKRLGMLPTASGPAAAGDRTATGLPPRGARSRQASVRSGRAECPRSAGAGARGSRCDGVQHAAGDGRAEGDQSALDERQPKL